MAAFVVTLSVVAGTPTASASPGAAVVTQTQVLASSEENRPVGVAVDAAGNRYVTGVFHGDLELGGGGPRWVDDHSGQVYVASYHPDGTFRWARRLGNGLADSVRGIVVTPNGNVVVHGSTFGAARIFTPYGVRTLPAYGVSDLYLVAFAASDGHVVWTRTDGGPGGDAPGPLVADAFGNITMLVGYAGTATYGEGAVSLTSAGMGDVAVVGYTAAGALRVARPVVVGPGDDRPGAIAVGAGALYIGGVWASTASVAGVTVTASQPHSSFVARVDATTGEGRWVRLLRPSDAGARPVVQQLAVGADGSLFVGGSFGGSVRFLPPGATVPVAELAVAAGRDLFVARYRANGLLSWARAGGATGGAASVPTVASLRPTGVGGVLLVGNATGTLDFGGAPVSAQGNDLLRAELDGAGDAVGAVTIGGPADEGASSAVAAPDGLVVAGTVWGDDPVALPGGLTLGTNRGDGFLLTLTGL